MIIAHGHKKIGFGQLFNFLGGAQGSGRTVHHKIDENPKAKPARFGPEIQFRSCGKKRMHVPLRQIHHIVTPRRGEDRIEHFHPAGDFVKIGKHSPARKKVPQRAFRRVGINQKRVAFIQQQIIRQQTRQQCFTIAVRV